MLLDYRQGWMDHTLRRTGMLLDYRQGWMDHTLRRTGMLLDYRQGWTDHRLPGAKNVHQGEVLIHRIHRCLCALVAAMGLFGVVTVQPPLPRGSWERCRG